MAEAVCGPSNALQQFKQQTSLDRSLQQDRFTSRRHQPQGFRSANANAGLLDPDFEAFQAGRSTPPVLDHMQPYQAASRFAPPSQLPSWASDFQRMSISAQPQLKQQKSGLFPASADSSSWATGFRDQFKQSVPRASSPSPLAFQQMARYGATGYQSSFAQPSFVPETLSTKGKAPVVDAFDEAAFERAFDLAREDMMADADVQVQAQPVEAVLEQVASTTVDVQRFEEPLSQRPPATMDMDYEPLSHMEQLPAVSQELPLQESMIEQPQHDDDALAATAQELLEKVEHNQSDKFKNSQFLGLMRKLADRQVRVEGDKMVETADAAVTYSSAGATLNPLSVDGRNAQHGIPHHEQDHDDGRFGVQDGQDVVNLLNDPGLAEEIGPYVQPRTAAADDVGMFAPESRPSISPSQSNSLSEMLYGSSGTLTQGSQ